MALVRPCPLFSDTVLILLKNFILLDFSFAATYVNLIFLSLTACINSLLVKLENKRNSLAQMIQNHLVFFSSHFGEVYMFVCLFYYFHKNLCVTRLNTVKRGNFGFRYPY